MPKKIIIKIKRKIINYIVYHNSIIKKKKER